MKTFVVLAALAAMAVAAPTLPEEKYRLKSTQYRPTTIVKREMKSTETHSNDPKPVELSPHHAQGSEAKVEPEVSARTFGLKKPIIVKKKLGYHLYRDSAEEQAQADPKEKCTKEVKVKLCDAESLAKSSDKMKSSTIEDVDEQMSESDIEHRIMMAKEAVENLQKMSQWKHAASGPDAELHEDIEIARRALEHIQKNFGDLESLSLRATTLSDAEALQDAHLKITDTEHDRMAQWKQAVANIQKNAEIAKNIEDSFKAAAHSSHLSNAEEINDSKKKSDHQQLKADSVLPFEERAFAKLEEHEKIVGKTAHEDKIDNDMTFAASEAKSSVVKIQDTAKNATPVKHDINGKSNESHFKTDNIKVESKNTESLTSGSDNHSITSSSTKAAIKEGKNADTIKSSDIQETAKEQDLKITQADHFVKSANDLEHESEHELRAVEEMGASASEHHLTLEKIAMKGDNNKNVVAKESENAKDNKDTSMKVGKAVDKDVPFIKSVEFGENHEKVTPEHQNLKVKDTHYNMKSADTLHIENSPKNTGHADLKSADQGLHQNNQMNSAASNVAVSQHDASSLMKAAEHEHQIQNNNFRTHIDAVDKDSHFAKSSTMKEAHHFVSDFHHGFHNGLHNGFHQSGLEHFGHPQHFKEAGTFRNQELSQGKSANMMVMKNTMGQSASEHRNLRNWKPEHNARWAYGGGSTAAGAGTSAGLSIGGSEASSGGSGAVGVFPNANVGGCAIPLLLSCSPSVTSGSLAKTHTYSGASSAAYRTGHDFNFHNKRDTKVKKSNQISSHKVKRTPTKIIEKIPYVVDKQL